MDHLGAGVGLILDCSTEEQAIRADYLTKLLRPPFPPNYIPNPRAFDGAATAEIYQRVLDTYSEPKCVALSKAFAKNHTWQTLTLIRLRTQDWGNDPLYRADPNLKYVDKTTVALWDKLGDQFAHLTRCRCRHAAEVLCLAEAGEQTDAAERRSHPDGL